MAHHAYLYTGPQEAGISAARSFLASERGLEGADNPDVRVFAFAGTFSVEDARRIIGFSLQAPVRGSEKAIVIAAGRLFPPTQNALLKTFEEPPPGTTLVLIVPAEGVLLPTLRSRLVPLPRAAARVSPEAEAFLASSQGEREKYVAKLVARSKDGKDEDKQAARQEALRLCEGLLVWLHGRPDLKERDQTLRELARFMPILHGSSAPVKLILEHLLLVLPETGSK